MQVYVHVIPDRDFKEAAPINGCYLRGVSLEHARFDQELRQLAECPPGTHRTPAPVLWMQPTPLLSADLSSAVQVRVRLPPIPSATFSSTWRCERDSVWLRDVAWTGWGNSSCFFLQRGGLADVVGSGAGVFPCPLYRSSKRTPSAGRHAQNRLVTVELGVGEHDVEHWARRGVALVSVVLDEEL